MRIMKNLKLQEYLSNFIYRLPDDPELILYDFYFLTAYGSVIETNVEEADFSIKEAVNEVIKSLDVHMKKALKYALCAEVRHIFDKLSDPFSLEKLVNKDKKLKAFIQNYYEKYLYLLRIEDTAYSFLNIYDRESVRLRNILSKENTSQRLASYKAVKMSQKIVGINEKEFAYICYDLFVKLNWNSSYGSDPWAAIAYGYLRLLGARNNNGKIIAIDHAYDLQHNTDTVFNKLKIYYKDGGYSWIKNALDWKRDNEDIRAFYKRVSPQLQRVVAFISYNVYNLTIEDYNKK